jgi:hypothetical protein
MCGPVQARVRLAAAVALPVAVMQEGRLLGRGPAVRGWVRGVLAAAAAAACQAAGTARATPLLQRTQRQVRQRWRLAAVGMLLLRLRVLPGCEKLAGGLLLARGCVGFWWQQLC